MNSANVFYRSLFGPAYKRAFTILAVMATLAICLSARPVLAQSGAERGGYLSCESDRAPQLAEFEGPHRIYPEDSNGKSICIYREREDGNAGVLLPEAWLEAGFVTPYLGLSSRDAVIETSFELVQRAADTYEALEGPLQSKVYVVFSEADTEFTFDEFVEGTISHTAMETSVFGRECYIAVRPFDDWVTSVPGVDPRDLFAFTLAHEVAHCYIGEKLEDIAATDIEADLDQFWWEEAAAELMAAEVVPAPLIMDQTMSDYRVAEDDFRQPYANAWLFDRLADGIGPSLLYDFGDAPASEFERLWQHVRYYAPTNNKASAYRLLREFGNSRNSSGEDPDSPYNNVLQYFLIDFAFPASGRTNGRCNRASDCAYQREATVGYSHPLINLADGPFTPGVITLGAVPGGRAFRVPVTVAPGRSIHIASGRRAYTSSEPSLGVTAIWHSPYRVRTLKQGTLNIGDCAREPGSFDLVVTHLSPTPVNDLVISFETQPCPTE